MVSSLMQNGSIAAIVNGIDWSLFPVSARQTDGVEFRYASLETPDLLIGRAGSSRARYTTGTGTVLHMTHLFVVRSESTGEIEKVQPSTACGYRATQGVAAANGRTVTCTKCQKRLTKGGTR